MAGSHQETTTETKTRRCVGPKIEERTLAWPHAKATSFHVISRPIPGTLRDCEAKLNDLDTIQTNWANCTRSRGSQEVPRPLDSMLPNSHSTPATPRPEGPVRCWAARRCWPGAVSSQLRPKSVFALGENICFGASSRNSCKEGRMTGHPSEESNAISERHPPLPLAAPPSKHGLFGGERPNPHADLASIRFCAQRPRFFGLQGESCPNH